MHMANKSVMRVIGPARQSCTIDLNIIFDHSCDSVFQVDNKYYQNSDDQTRNTCFLVVKWQRMVRFMHFSSPATSIGIIW